MGIFVPSVRWCSSSLQRVDAGVSFIHKSTEINIHVHIHSYFKLKLKIVTVNIMPNSLDDWFMNSSGIDFFTIFIVYINFTTICFRSKCTVLVRMFDFYTVMCKKAAKVR